MLYLHWFDDSAKKSACAKIEEARQARAARFGSVANVALVSESDGAINVPGCEIKVEKRIGPNNYQVGRTE